MNEKKGSRKFHNFTHNGRDWVTSAKGFPAAGGECFELELRIANQGRKPSPCNTLEQEEWLNRPVLPFLWQLQTCWFASCSNALICQRHRHLWTFVSERPEVPTQDREWTSVFDAQRLPIQWTIPLHATTPASVDDRNLKMKSGSRPKFVLLLVGAAPTRGEGGPDHSWPGIVPKTMRICHNRQSNWIATCKETERAQLGDIPP